MADAHAKGKAQLIVSDPSYDLWQGNYSSDGRWIIFEAVEDQTMRSVSTIYVLAAAGGHWQFYSEYSESRSSNARGLYIYVA